MTHLHPDTAPHPPPQTPFLHLAGPTVLSFWSGVPAPPQPGLTPGPPDLSTLFPGHWGHTHAAPPDPTAAKPLSQMRMATPMLMHALPMEGMGVRTIPGWFRGKCYLGWTEGRCQGAGETS